MTAYQAPDGMVEVTWEEFFAFLEHDQRGIMPHHGSPEFTTWETRGRAVVGRSLPGWRNPGDPKAYFLVEPRKAAAS